MLLRFIAIIITIITLITIIITIITTIMITIMYCRPDVAVVDNYVVLNNLASIQLSIWLKLLAVCSLFLQIPFKGDI